MVYRLRPVPRLAALLGALALGWGILATPALGASAGASGSQSLGFSTFLGGHDRDTAQDVAADQAGNLYVLTLTTSKNFPADPHSFDKKLDKSGWGDAAVSKFDPTGQELIWSTFLGGDGMECSLGCELEVDAAGAVYVAGSTSSADFPTTAGAFDTTFNSEDEGVFTTSDVFVAKLDPGGGSLVYSTFLGGSTHDFGIGLALDSSGAAYVTGSTHSGEFPTTAGAFDATLDGSSDAFVAKLDPSGESLVYSTFLGGTDGDTAFPVRVDSSGAAYVAGLTHSADFPTTAEAFDATFNGGSQDGFVVKFDPAGGSLVYSTFLGGGNLEYVEDLRVDGNGAAYVTGQTRSADFPTTAEAFDTTLGGGQDMFVAKFDPSGGSLAYSTFLGGSEPETAGGIAVTGSGAAVVTGSTSSPDYPTTPDAFDQSLDTADAVVSRLDPSGASLTASTFLGGQNRGEGEAVTVGTNGASYVVGSTGSPDFPTTRDAYDTRFNSKTVPAPDVFATQLRLTTQRTS